MIEISEAKKILGAEFVRVNPEVIQDLIDLMYKMAIISVETYIDDHYTK